MKILPVSLCVLAVAVGGSLSSPAFATPGPSTHVHGQSGGRGGAFFSVSGIDSAGMTQDFFDSGFRFNPFTGLFGPYFDSGTVAAEARAASGSLGASVYALANQTSGFGDSVSADATAQFSDTLTITAPGAIGTGGIVFGVGISVNLVGGYSATSGTGYPIDRAYVSYEYALNTDTGSFFHSSEACQGVNCSVGADLNTGLFQTTPLTFTFGVPFSLSGFLLLETSVTQGPGEFGFASLAMMNSADLKGIISLTDAAGNPVTNFTITAASGADYTQPFGAPSAPADASVPEPSTLLLLGTGLAGCGCRLSVHARCRS